MFHGKKAILFDMDGTLIDSVGIWNQVDQAVIEQLGQVRMDEAIVQAQRDAKLREFAGEPNPYAAYCGFLGKRYGSELTAEEILELRKEVSRTYLKERVDYKEGVPELLACLKEAGYVLAIASTTRRMNMEIYRDVNQKIRAKAPIDVYFPLILTCEDVEERKPHPAIYLKAMEMLEMAPSECLIFEDSLIGVEAAVRSGAEVAAVYDPYSREDWEKITGMADYAFADFGEVRNAWEKEQKSSSFLPETVI